MSIADLLPAMLTRISMLRARCLDSAHRPSAEEIAADLSQLEADLVRLQTTVTSSTAAGTTHPAFTPPKRSRTKS